MKNECKQIPKLLFRQRLRKISCRVKYECKHFASYLRALPCRSREAVKSKSYPPYLPSPISSQKSLESTKFSAKASFYNKYSTARFTGTFKCLRAKLSSSGISEKERYQSRLQSERMCRLKTCGKSSLLKQKP